MDWFHRLVEKWTGKHVHAFVDPSPLDPPDPKIRVYRCRCGTFQMERKF